MKSILRPFAAAALAFSTFAPSTSPIAAEPARPADGNGWYPVATAIETRGPLVIFRQQDTNRVRVGRPINGAIGVLLDGEVTEAESTVPSLNIAYAPVQDARGQALRCADPSTMTGALKKNFNESPLIQFIDQRGDLNSVFYNREDAGNWTLTRRSPSDDKSCIEMAGIGFQVLDSYEHPPVQNGPQSLSRQSPAAPKP